METLHETNSNAVMELLELCFDEKIQYFYKSHFSAVHLVEQDFASEKFAVTLIHESIIQNKLVNT